MRRTRTYLVATASARLVTIPAAVITAKVDGYWPWAATYKNTDGQTPPRASIGVFISNDPTETAASVTDWFDVQADMAGMSSHAVLPIFATAAEGVITMFGGPHQSPPCRWVQIVAGAGIGQTCTASFKLYGAKAL